MKSLYSSVAALLVILAGSAIFGPRVITAGPGLATDSEASHLARRAFPAKATFGRKLWKSCR